jgi:hypothetical protein
VQRGLHIRATLVIKSAVLKWCYSGVAVVLHRCYSGVTGSGGPSAGGSAYPCHPSHVVKRVQHISRVL